MNVGPVENPEGPKTKSGRLLGSIIPHTVPQLFQFSQSPERLKFFTRHLVHDRHYVADVPLDLGDADNASLFIRGRVMDDVPDRASSSYMLSVTVRRSSRIRKVREIPRTIVTFITNVHRLSESTLLE
jgi:hypothetical protein